jgi:uroporphyrin-III C-methyltransferase/precorrin-2 dehydrogenase/sirohydrochlorin ferrochelatase
MSLTTNEPSKQQELFMSLTAMTTSTAKAGHVYLIGAGPGDPELITLRAVRLLSQADVVVYDHLVSTAILDFVPATAQRIYAGKRRNEHNMRQEQINQSLVDLAKQGLRVMRLKGGDPFIFGRGGEEMQELAAHDVLFEVVPGITAASGIASYSGIPLTHRDFAQTCLFVTGHLKDGTSDLDWPALTRPKQTVVIYMGLNALPDISQQLITHGLSPEHPIGVIQHGTTINQRVITGQLNDIADKVSKAKLASPSLIIVGEVVQLHETLRWFIPQAVAQTPKSCYCEKPTTLP